MSPTSLAKSKCAFKRRFPLTMNWWPGANPPPPTAAGSSPQEAAQAYALPVKATQLPLQQQPCVPRNSRLHAEQELVAQTMGLEPLPLAHDMAKHRLNGTQENRISSRPVRSATVTSGLGTCGLAWAGCPSSSKLEPPRLKQDHSLLLRQSTCCVGLVGVKLKLRGFQPWKCRTAAPAVRLSRFEENSSVERPRPRWSWGGPSRVHEHALHTLRTIICT